MNSKVDLQERAKDPNFWQEMWQQVRLIWRLVRDPAVPAYLKLIPAAALIYLIVPIDILPDAFLGLGQLDDLGVLLLGARTFTQMVPKGIVAAHLEAIRSEDGYPSEKIIIIDSEDDKSAE